MLPRNSTHKLHFTNQYGKPFCGTESPLVTDSLTKSDCKSCERLLARKWGIPVDLYRRMKVEAKEEARAAVEDFLIREKERQGSQEKPRYQLGHRQDS